MSAVGRALAGRIGAVDWDGVRAGLDERGVAVVPGLVPAPVCEALRRRYAAVGDFRSTVVMARHNFGRGEYKYFAYPLPSEVATLRCALYAQLAPVANGWARKLGETRAYPARHEEYLARCRAAGQAQPTPLLLRYGPGDYNNLHRDLYGDAVFPLQVVTLLSEPGVDFDGGELVLVEQRPRMQSRAHVVPLRVGDAAVFAVNHLPRPGARGHYRASLRHGVSEIRRGERYTLGVIFHDAR